MFIPDNILDHLAKIWAGEYDLHLDVDKPLSILDLGANVGAFAFWALVRWPTATLTCYEPVPDNFRVLEKNIGLFANRVRLHNEAVCDMDSDKHRFFIGLNNCGEGSLYFGPEQSEDTIEVKVIHANQIPYHDLVKIDTEGAEVDILKSLAFKPCAFMIEYHSTENRLEIDRLLASDYLLVAHRMYHLRTGLLKYIRKDIINT